MSKSFLPNTPYIRDTNLLAADMQIEMHRRGYADVMYEKIMNQIYEFEKQLKPNEEVGAYLTNFGKEIIIQIESVAYQNPYLIIFKGKNTLDSSDVQHVQHVSQVNLLFVAVKLAEERKPYRIGFQIDQTKEKSNNNK